MELKEFIKETLMQIIEGVEEAQNMLDSKDCIINPKKNINYDAKTGKANKLESAEKINVDFEVVLSKVDKAESKAGIGVLFGNIGIGGHEKTDDSTSSVTSVRFSVPIKYTEGEK